MEDIILTENQKQGLEIAVKRYREHKPYTCISGYAGSGKSTLVQFIIQALGIPPFDVCYIAYTGKAALVLKEKGNRVVKFIRYAVGEGIEKRQDNFAEEVMKEIK